MKAVEFETSVKNGLIHVPEQYRDPQVKNVRIIMLIDEPMHVASPNSNSSGYASKLLGKYASAPNNSADFMNNKIFEKILEL